MATNTQIPIAAAKASVNTIVDRMDTGTGANARVRIYSGTQPTNADTAPGTGNVLLCEIDCGTGAVFGAAATGTGTETNSAVALATGLTGNGETALTTPTVATWFRAINKGGTTVIDGSVGLATADMILSNTSIAASQAVTISTWKVKQARGA